MKKDSRTEPDYRLVVVLAAAFVAAFGLAVWLWLAGRPPGEGSPEAGFARDMIVHHAQAVQMAEIVRDRTDSEDVRILAADIALGQQAQIGIMQGWLGAWGLPPAPSPPGRGWATLRTVVSCPAWPPARRSNAWASCPRTGRTSCS